MQRDVEAELAELRGVVAALSAEVGALARAVKELPGPGKEVARGTVRDEPAGDPPFPRAALWQATEHLAARAAELRASGLVTFAGCYTGADAREYRWKREKIAEELLAQDDEIVARVLAALGHKQRLALLKAILERPAPASELIERLGLTSTGQAYHHLNTLAAAGLIRQGERGQFAFVGHQAPAFLTLLAGVWGMLGTRYGTGTWGEESDPAAPGDRDGPAGVGVGDTPPAASGAESASEEVC